MQWRGEDVALLVLIPAVALYPLVRVVLSRRKTRPPKRPVSLQCRGGRHVQAPRRCDLLV
jgi:hypothetical protein